MIDISFFLITLDKVKDQVLSLLVWMQKQTQILADSCKKALNLMISFLFLLYRDYFVESICCLARLLSVLYTYADVIHICVAMFLSACFSWSWRGFSFQAPLHYLFDQFKDPANFDTFSPWIRSFFLGSLLSRILQYIYQHILFSLKILLLYTEALMIVSVSQLLIFTESIDKIDEWLKNEFLHLPEHCYEYWRDQLQPLMMGWIRNFCAEEPLGAISLGYLSIKGLFILIQRATLASLLNMTAFFVIGVVFMTAFVPAGMFLLIWSKKVAESARADLKILEKNSLGNILILLKRNLRERLFSSEKPVFAVNKSWFKERFSLTQGFECQTNIPTLKQLIRIYIAKSSPHHQLGSADYTQSDVLSLIDHFDDRSQALSDIYQVCENVLDFMNDCKHAKKDHLLELIENMTKMTTMSACVNQPILAMMTLNAFIQIANQNNLLQKCENALYLQALHETHLLCIKIMEKYAQNPPTNDTRQFTAGVTDAEFCNEMMRQIYAKFLTLDISHDHPQWIGIPRVVPHVAMVKINPADVDQIVEKICQTTLASDDQSMLSFLTNHEFAHMLMMNHSGYQDELTKIQETSERLLESIEDSLIDGALNWETLLQKEPSLVKYVNQSYAALLNQIATDRTHQEVLLKTKLYPLLQQKIPEKLRDSRMDSLTKETQFEVKKEETDQLEENFYSGLTSQTLSLTPPSFEFPDQEELKEFATPKTAPKKFEERSQLFQKAVTYINKLMTSKFVKKLSAVCFRLFSQPRVISPDPYDSSVSRVISPPGYRTCRAAYILHDQFSHDGISYFKDLNGFITMPTKIFSAIFPSLQRSEVIEASELTGESISYGLSGLLFEHCYISGKPLLWSERDTIQKTIQMMHPTPR